MKDAFIKLLLTELNKTNFVATSCKSRDVEDYFSNDTRVIPFDYLLKCIENLDEYTEAKACLSGRKRKRVAFVEDGSVDLDELKKALRGTNTKIVVYRSGTHKPNIESLE